MGLKILLVYLLGILLCQPVYIWGIRTLCRMEDEDEELYCQDNGMYYEPIFQDAQQRPFSNSELLLVSASGSHIIDNRSFWKLMLYVLDYVIMTISMMNHVYVFVLIPDVLVCSLFSSVCS